MITMADFFPSGRVEFVKPHFDERYWATFVYPARPVPHLWGSACQRGLEYKSTSDVQGSGPGQRRTFGGGRKSRGYASGESGKI